MNTQQLLDTIRKQQEEINRLNDLLTQNPKVDYQTKYKKALKDISGVIKANRQLKQELDKLRVSRQSEVDSYSQIQKEQFHKAYEKLLKEKNQLSIINQNLQFEKEKLKYSVESLEEYVAQLKSQQMNLARQKQALERNNYKKTQSPQKNVQKPIEKNVEKVVDEGKEQIAQIAILKQKQAEYHRTIQNYQEHHANLNRANRQLEQNISQLQGKLNKNNLMWRAAVQAKQVEIHQAKAQIRKELQDQISQLKKQNSNLRTKMSEMTMKIQTLQIDQISQGEPTSQKQYQMELLYTLQQLKSQMEPMRGQISDLQENNHLQKQQSMRERANLKMKVIELDSQLQQVNDNCKSLEQKLIHSNEKERHYQDQDKLIKKLEEQNRMLGGRVIVLESKDVALRNRNGEELQQKVLQFQTRVQMLLSDKQNISTIKNVSIHQMIALKAYIMQLDGKLRALLSENEYSVKKYKNYKQKYQNLTRQMKKHEGIINSYKNKIYGYDRLVLKLQGELERSLNMYDVQLNSQNIKISQEETTTSIEIHRRRFAALKEKLELQEKYAKQQLQTNKLHYETKLMQSNIKLQEIKNLKQTIQLYKLKNQEIASKLSEKENQILEIRLGYAREKHSIPQDQSTINSKSKQLIQSLHITISDKQALNIRLQGEIRRLQEQWRKKYTVLQKQYQNYKQDAIKPNSSLSRNLQTKIYELQQDVRRYKQRITQLEQQSASVHHTPKLDEGRFQDMLLKISSLELDRQEINGKLQTTQFSKKRLQQQLKQLQQQNSKLQGAILQIQRQSRDKIHEYMNSLNRRDDEIRAQSYQVNASYSEITHRLSQQQSKNHRLTFQLQNLRNQLRNSQQNYQKINEKYHELNIKFEDVRQKLDVALDEKERLQVNSSRLENKKKQIQEDLKERQNFMSRIDGEQYSLRAQLDSMTNLERRMNLLEGQTNQKDRIINRLNHEISRLNQQNTVIYEKDAQISQLRNELSRIKATYNSQSDDLSAQVNQLVQQIYSLKTNINTLNISAGHQEEEIQNYKIQISRLGDQNTQVKNKNNHNQHTIMELQSRIQRVSNQNNRNRQALDEVNDMLHQKDNQIIRLSGQNRQYQFLKVQYDEIRSVAQHRQQLLNKLSLDMRLLQAQTSQTEDKEKWIAKLKNQINSMRIEYGNTINQLEDKLMEKQQLISKINYELSIERDNSIERGDRYTQLQQHLWKFKQEHSQLQDEIARQQLLITQRDMQINKFSYDLKQAQASYHDLQSSRQQMQFNLTMTTNQLYSYKNTSQSNFNLLNQRQNNINRLGYEISHLRQTINSLEGQIEQRDHIISRQNIQISQFRLESTSQFDDISNKQQIIANLNFQFNSLRNKYQYLEDELGTRDNNWNQATQELHRVQINISNYQDELQTKNSLITRHRLQIQRMKSQIEQLNSQISYKNIEISRISQQLFKRNYDDQSQNRIQITRMQQQLSNMKFKMNALQLQLEDKQDTIGRLRNEVRVSQKTIPSATLYSQQDFNRIRQEAYRIQRQLTIARNDLIDKDFVIGQMQGKLSIQNKTYIEEKRIYEEQVEGLQLQIERLIQKQRNLMQRFNESQYFDKDKTEQAQFGLKLYEQEIQRLRTIVKELQQEVEQLRLKMTNMTNQQDRIQENLTTLVLTFAQVEALRERIKSKENQITQVRKSLLGISQQGIIHVVSGQHNTHQQEITHLIHQQRQQTMQLGSAPISQQRVSNPNSARLIISNQPVMEHQYPGNTNPTTFFVPTGIMMGRDQGVTVIQGGQNRTGVVTSQVVNQNEISITQRLDQSQRAKMVTSSVIGQHSMNPYLVQSQKNSPVYQIQGQYVQQPSAFNQPMARIITQSSASFHSNYHIPNQSQSLPPVHHLNQHEVRKYSPQGIPIKNIISQPPPPRQP